MFFFAAAFLLQVASAQGAACVNPSCATPPCAAALTGDVGCTTVSGQEANAFAIYSAGHTVATNAHIHGPFEAGFTSTQNSVIQGWGCTNPSLVYDAAGGLDLMNAEAKVAAACSLTNFPSLSGSAYNGIVAECGGHTSDYHFHVRLSCLYKATAGSGHSTKVGDVASYSLYGKHEHLADSKLPLLDACGAHFGTNPDSTSADVYHYHVQDYPPFTVGCHGPAAGNTKMTVSGCRALYNSGSNKCDSAPDATFTIKQRSDPNGPATGVQTSITYDRWCPCFDANHQNIATSIVELPAISCSLNWYSGTWSSTACGSGSNGSSGGTNASGTTSTTTSNNGSSTAGTLMSAAGSSSKSVSCSLQIVLMWMSLYSFAHMLRLLL